MKVSLCTISFRHCLVSMKEIAAFAKANGFDGIEIWAAHARSLARAPLHNAEWLASFGLAAPMLSDYLPTDSALPELRRRTDALCALAARWRAPKIRTFAGATPSAAADAEDWRRTTAALRASCEVAEDNGMELLVETHPNTLADNLASTLRLIDAVDHPALGINFDVLHVWEGGDDPVAACQALAPLVGHFHLKNVRSRADLAVFEPGNVYAAAGRRDGMVPLFDGALDYAPILPLLPARAEASLEWFGDEPFETLARDRRALDAVARRATAA